MDNIIEIKDKIKTSLRGSHYVENGETTEEDKNTNDKYATTGESEFSRDNSHPLDEVLSERHYILSGVQSFLRERFSGEKRSFAGLAPKGYQRSDVRIMEDVNDALMRSRSVDPSDIEVSIDRGVVTLSGFVPTRAMKKSAEAVAEKVYGVSDVLNQISISAHGKPLIHNHTGLN